MKNTRPSPFDVMRKIKALTRRYPAWARRRCRREAVALLRRYMMLMDFDALERLRESARLWQSTPWGSLPPDLERDVMEDNREHVNRCYAAWRQSWRRK